MRVGGGWLWDKKQIIQAEVFFDVTGSALTGRDARYLLSNVTANGPIASKGYEIYYERNGLNLTFAGYNTARGSVAAGTLNMTNGNWGYAVSIFRIVHDPGVSAKLYQLVGTVWTLIATLTDIAHIPAGFSAAVYHSIWVKSAGANQNTVGIYKNILVQDW
ncbi:hypothetical protein ES705_18396 [subsurface metagenome]